MKSTSLKSSNTCKKNKRKRGLSAEKRGRGFSRNMDTSIIIITPYLCSNI